MDGKRSTPLQPLALFSLDVENRVKNSGDLDECVASDVTRLASPRQSLSLLNLLHFLRHPQARPGRSGSQHSSSTPCHARSGCNVDAVVEAWGRLRSRFRCVRWLAPTTLNRSSASSTTGHIYAHSVIPARSSARTLAHAKLPAVWFWSSTAGIILTRSCALGPKPRSWGRTERAEG
jgi:hypothetical protein